METLVRLCAEQPAKRFGVHPRKGTLDVGADADITIVDMNRRDVLTRANMHSRSGHTSWEGVPVHGMPVHTIVRGESVMHDGKVVGRPGYGRFTPGVAAKKH